MSEEKKLVSQEALKKASRGLAGDIAREFAEGGETVTDDTYELLKFHGSYFGYDRDTATERKKAGLDKKYEFMVRLKMPGGRLTAEQYLAMDELAEKYANGSLRITTRETFQFHCVHKVGMKPLIAAINRTKLSTIAGCGDIVRNVTTTSAPIKNPRFIRLEQDTYKMAKHVAPRTESYVQIWLDGERVDGWATNVNEETLAPFNAEGKEPIYGDTYLPRKFKIGLAAPEDNSNDILSNDLAFVGFFNAKDELEGYNVCIGGGQGVQHNNPKTYPRVASPVAFIEGNDLLRMAEAVIKLQRDFGDRTNRRHARIKYLIEEEGTTWVQEKLADYFGKPLTPPRPMPPMQMPDHMGWHEQGDGLLWLGIPIASGRIENRGAEKIRDGLKAAIARWRMPVILTADQNLILYDIAPHNRDDITALLKQHGIKLREDISNLYRDTLACVALPTCGKALAEAERIKLPLVEKVENTLDRLGLQDRRIALSIAGCPNGCSRPYTGDIGVVGRTPGHYALYVGGDFACTRLNRKIFDKVPYDFIPAALEGMLAHYKSEAAKDEGFGDFCLRAGLETMKAKANATLKEKHNWTE